MNQSAVVGLPLSSGHLANSESTIITSRDLKIGQTWASFFNPSCFLSSLFTTSICSPIVCWTTLRRFVGSKLRILSKLIILKSFWPVLPEREPNPSLESDEEFFFYGFPSDHTRQTSMKIRMKDGKPSLVRLSDMLLNDFSNTFGVEFDGIWLVGIWWFIIGLGGI